jgi:hypothetical protein
MRKHTTAPFNINFITIFDNDAQIRVCAEERVPIVSFHWGHPSTEHVKLLRDAGVSIWEHCPDDWDLGTLIPRRDRGRHLLPQARPRFRTLHLARARPLQDLHLVCSSGPQPGAVRPPQTGIVTPTQSAASMVN